MEPEGQPLTPGTSYGPLPSNSAQTPPPTASAFDNSSSPQSPCSPKDDPMSAKQSWDGLGNEDSVQTEGTEPGRSAQRRVRSSAFPSSLSWDSDSEKETLDEEELLHLSNPHGLAAHSPGSPSAGLRLDCEDGQEPEPEVQTSPTETDLLSQEEGQENNSESTKTEEPNTSQLGPNKSVDSTVWNVSEGAQLFLSKPKEGCQMVEEEADNKEGAKRHMGKESKEKEIDVYTFPGDSDPESPPPAPWAHCTFIQRCRKKRVLLRPFSGVGSMKSPETGRRAKGSSGNAKNTVSEGVYDFDEEESLEEPVRESQDQEEDSNSEMDKEIFTCVECSIYFKKQVHLQEHMVEHSQSTSEGNGKEKLVKGSRFRCDECGWSLPNRLALTDHQRKHQESRVKILKEIEKLNENEKAKKEDGNVLDGLKLDATFSRKALDTELGASPPLSPRRISTPNTDYAIVDLANRSTDRTPVQGRGLGGYRRRFVCTTCNFSTRTPQALANHSKTHNRRTSLASSSLACSHCAFQTSSQTVLREHQKLAHPGKLSIGGAQAEENGQLLKPALDSHRSPTGKTHKGYIASEDSTIPDGTEARPTSQVFKCIGNRRFSRRGKTWTNVAKYHAGSEYDKLSGSEDEVEDQTTDLDSIISQEQAKSTLRTRTLSNSDYSLVQRGTTRILPTRRSVRHEDKQDVDRDGKVFLLRRSSRVTAATAELCSDDEEDDFDEEHTRRLLSEGISDEDKEEIDEDMEALKSVERKCPYCPDRFHNGIGLANHVRGHLNRVGVSYNVRHFISPEEVNAIERKFSYQKKKKKVANFDPDTFSVMHCEFCSAGFDTRAGLSSHARAHLRDLGITNWDVTISPIHVLREVFSSRPDLVIPTDPPRSPDESDEEEEEEERESDEENEIIEVKLEGDSSERILTAAVLDALPSASDKSWKHEDIKECKDEEEEAADEEDDDALQLAALSSSPRKTGLHRDRDRSPQEDARTKVNHVKCEVCGAQFETRRGLSSHARSHLRQLGIRGSETSGAPIDFLYQIAKERNLDSQISPSLQEPTLAENPSPSAPQKDDELEVMDVDKKPIPPSILAKAAKAVPPPASCSTPSPGASPAPALSGSPSSVVRKAPISSLLPVSSPLRSLEHKAGGIKGLTSNLSTIPTSKPLWAPQENDAPLNLTLEVDPNKDIVCQLCGAWFETRKGLSSHARAHLRHFGVEYSESKGSPIDLLGQLIESEDFKHKASALELDGPPETQGLGNTLSSPKQSLLTLPAPSSSPLLYKVTTAGGGSTSKTTSASPLLGPPAKRLKPSSMQVFRLSSGELMALPHSEPPKEIGCEFCGEYFENRKGLSSHARSHLRQMGITQWSVNGSPIDTLREIIARRGLPCALPLKPLKTPPPSSPAPPRSPLSTSSSPPAALLSRLPFAFARRPSPPHLAVSKLNSAPTSSLSGLILKVKPEPVQLEVTTPGAVARSGGYSPQGLNSTWSSADSVHPLNLAMAHEVEPTRDIRCEFCGEYFENRKGLSSHARSHLRQMGITQWSVNGSPIDTLREVMRKRGLGNSASLLEQEVKKESSVEPSCPSWASAGGSGTSGGVCTYQSSSLRKSPLSLVQSGSRLYKPGLSSVGTSVTPSAGRFFRISPLGKRPLSEEASSLETAHSPPHHLKTYSPLPRDLSFNTKSPPVKHRPDPSCELCGFYFENRKALASHARAHLRQFGVTEWSVNGSPIETLSAWMRSRPQKVLEMHRSYMQGSRSPLKKKCRSPVSVSADSDHVLPVSSQKASSSSSASQWSSSLAVSLVRPIHRELAHCSSKTAEGGSGTGLDASPIKAGCSSPSPSRLSGSLPLQAQVARSELNVRLPRGFERRPLKHPSCPDGTERDSSSPRPLRTGTVPALVPKPPSYPLVKLEGNFYTLKCRFCEVEFHGPLSVQEDWIRHLQQHILKMNYKKPAALKPAAAVPSEAPASADNSTSAPASTSTSGTCTTAPALTSSPAHTPAPNSHSPPPPPAKCAPANTATELDTISEEQPTVTPAPVPLAEAV